MSKSAAKRQPGNARLPPMSEKGKRMLGKLKGYYKLGQRAAKSPDRAAVSDLAERHGYSRSTARKMREFARRYSPQQFRRLCQLRRPNGLPLHWGYMPYLLTVEDPIKRAKFEDSVAKHGWTAPELYAEIRRGKGRPAVQRGGRPQKEAADPGIELALALPQTLRWANRCRSAIEKLLARARRPGNDLDGVLSQAKQLSTAAKEIQRAVEELVDHGT